MIEILLFNEGSRASQYGIGTYIREMIHAFRNKEQFHLSVIYTRAPEPEFSYSTEDNITWYSIPNAINDTDNERAIGIYYRNLWFVLRPFLTDQLFEKIILHLNYYQHTHLIDYFKEDFPQGISIFTIHYLDWCFKIKGNLPYLKKMISEKDDINLLPTEKDVINIYIKEKALFEKVDKIICLSRYTEKVIEDIYKIEGKTTLLYNGLTEDCSFSGMEEKQKIKRSLFLDQQEQILLFVGRLDSIKGVGELLQAFRLVLERNNNCRLFIVGDGAYEYYLKKCNSLWSRVSFTGSLSKDELSDLYKIADIGIMPSFHEQCSYVAIEFMMYGVPLIIATSTGLTEMVEDGVSGLHIPVFSDQKQIYIDTTVLSEKIMTLLNDCEYRNLLSRNARKRYETFYTNEIMCRKWEQVYEEL